MVRAGTFARPAELLLTTFSLDYYSTGTSTRLAGLLFAPGFHTLIFAWMTMTPLDDDDAAA
jgi:hypothetical protein